MPSRPHQGLISFIVIFCLFFLSNLLTNQIGYSANLPNASITLSNPRPSFRAALTATNTSGSSLVSIKTSGSPQPSLSTSQVRHGDTVLIGSGANQVSYTAESTNPPGQFSIDGTLTANNSAEDTIAIARQQTRLTVAFQTANAIANGRFQVLVPAHNTPAQANDGIPDSGFFDFGTSAPSVTCPNDITGYDFVGGTAHPSHIQLDGQNYHAFICEYSGTGAVGTMFDGQGGNPNPILIEGLINPAPRTGYTAGQAEPYQLHIRHLDSGLNVQDSVTVSVGTIEAIKVTATITPIINFSVSGVAAASNKCGVQTTVTTTPTEVPFGVLDFLNFFNAAHTLSVSTNAANGYAVTTRYNDQLGLNGQACPGAATANTNCIAGPPGDTSVMTHTNTDSWTQTATKGFAYSLGNISASETAFTYSGSSGGCIGGGGEFCARQFADAEQGQSPVWIMRGTTIADNEQTDVCYRIIPRVQTAAGTYENTVTYTATATF